MDERVALVITANAKTGDVYISKGVKLKRFNVIYLPLIIFLHQTLIR